jgi:hypothetical protein
MKGFVGLCVIIAVALWWFGAFSSGPPGRPTPQVPAPAPVQKPAGLPAATREAEKPALSHAPTAEEEALLPVSQRRPRSELTPDELKARDLADYRLAQGTVKAKKQARKLKKEFEALVAGGMKELEASGLMAKIDAKAGKLWVRSAWSELPVKAKLGVARIAHGHCFGGGSSRLLTIYDTAGNPVALYDGSDMRFAP